MGKRSAARQRDQTERMEALYARLPRIECKGRCASACGVIAMQELEARRMRRAAGGRPHSTVTRPNGDVRCSYLDANDRCSVYAVRPTVCRLWGVVETMPCTHGCLADGERLLTAKEGFTFLMEARAISGHSEETREFLAALEDPETLKALEGIARQGQEVGFACPEEGCRGRVNGRVGGLGACDVCRTVYNLAWQ